MPLRCLLALLVAASAAACAGASSTPGLASPAPTPSQPGPSRGPATPAASLVVPSGPASTATASAATTSPSAAPAGSPVTRTFRLPVQAPSVTKVAPQDRVADQPNGGIVITTVRTADHPLHLEWQFDPAALPDGATASHVDTRVCGRGDGDFYEVYGPYDSDPVEYEVKPPASDGCWHFSGSPSDWNVSIYVYGDASMTIDRIELDITSDR